MPIELNLRFPDADTVIVRGPDGDESASLPFANPIGDADLRDIQWYIETYGAHSLGDPDDAEAQRIAGQLPVWGQRLFNAVFTAREASRRFNAFQDAEDETRLLTITAEHPAILALPWELLCDPASGGGFLFMEEPHISIRRRVAGALGGRPPFKATAKDSLHLLFIVSRPDDAGFLDPRADSLSVLDAIAEHAPGRVTCEFLRPATLNALLDRLKDDDQPPVDILHFDGHGVFDREGELPKRVEEDRARRLGRADEFFRDRGAEPPHGSDAPPNMGYLLFEKPDGHADFVSAEKLGKNLQRHKIALVVLSACQSASIGQQRDDEETETEAEADARPMGSVAARLTATGIPSVLAMTHAVLVHTTRTLFGQFYKQLVQHQGIGEALDEARRYVFNNPEKYEVQRLAGRVPLRLYDWFLPALYQPGADGPLLRKLENGASARRPDVPARPLSNLRAAPEAGFFGRRRELWNLEQWFAGATRRITITGFGGQGKTALAQEAGRWLTRAGLFQAAVFVDYAKIQSRDSVAVALNNIGTVLGETLIDAAAGSAALAKTRTLVILDNLEALADEPLQALLSAAVDWSRSGGSRVLCTTRRPEFGHPDYRVEGTLHHRRIVLDGLGRRSAPDDALEWFAALVKLPPAPTIPPPGRKALIDLFDRVGFHPLSIRVLAQQLKTRRPEELGQRLEELLAPPAAAAGTSKASNPSTALNEDTPASLLASLQLSLDQLDAASCEVLPRLGVFQGGAFEDDLLVITGLAEDDVKEGEPPRAASIWLTLRRQLEAAALIEVEPVPGVSLPFLRFHPTLAPMLWEQLDAASKGRLATAHRDRYRAVSTYLYEEDSRHPHQARAIASRELPNLLYAVHGALRDGDTTAGEFVSSLSRFLEVFGLRHESEDLTAKAAAAAAGGTGSRAWYLAQSGLGEQLYQQGQMVEAARIFESILQHEQAPTHQRAITLARLARCLAAGGRPGLARGHVNSALEIVDQLPPSDIVTDLRMTLLTDLADSYAASGQFAQARAWYKTGLDAAIAMDKHRHQAVTQGQLAGLARREGNLEEARQRYQSTLTLFQQLREPASEAIVWHQLGFVFQEMEQWNEAERHFRESARIKEELGNLAGAARSWNHLAVVSEALGKLGSAESWYKKAIEGGRKMGDWLPTSRALNNLAHFYSRVTPKRLAEARVLADEALAIKETLDPGVSEIWTTYEILARILGAQAELDGDATSKAALRTQAHEYRRRARRAQFAFAGTRHKLKKHSELILEAVFATSEPAVRPRLEASLASREKHGWTKLVAAIRLMLAGEREADTLCDNLDLEDSMIVEAILQGIADPSTLADLMPEEESADEAAAE